MKFVSRIFEVLRRDSPSLIVYGNLIASMLALIAAPIVARGVGPEGRGETAAALAAFAIVPIVFSMGIPLEIRRLAAIQDGAASVRSARDLFLLALLPSAGAAFLLNQTVFTALSVDAKVLTFIGITLAPLGMSWMNDVSVLIGRGQFRGVFLIRVAQPTIFVCAVFFGLLVEAISVEFILGAHIASTAFLTAVGAFLTKVPLRGPRASHRQLAVKGLRYSGSTIAEAASNRLDQILILPLIGAGEAGLYSVAVTIGTLPLALGHALGAGYFRDMARAESSHYRILAARHVRATSSVAFLACGILACMVPFAVPLVFGESFDRAVTPTLLILVGSFAMTVAYVLSMILAAGGMGIRMTVAQWTALAVALSSLYLLAPIFGATGAAVASSISYLVLVAMLLVGVRVAPHHLFPTPRGVVAGIRRLIV